MEVVPITTLAFSINIKFTFSHNSSDSLGLYLSPKCLFYFLSKIWGKFSNLWCLDYCKIYLRVQSWIYIFPPMPAQVKLSPRFLLSPLTMREITDPPRECILENLLRPSHRKGAERKLC